MEIESKKVTHRLKSKEVTHRRKPKEVTHGLKSKERHRSKRRSLSRYPASEKHAISRFFEILQREPPQVPIEKKMELTKIIEESDKMGIIYPDSMLSDYEHVLLLPCQKSKPSHLPWVFFKHVSDPNHLMFGDIQKRRGYCLESRQPHLSLLYSKDGWLLFTAPYSDDKTNKTLNSADGKREIYYKQLGLVNPCTGKRFDLSLLAVELRCGDYHYKEYAAFTTAYDQKGQETKPNQVIYISAILGKYRIFLTRLGDKHWTNYTLKFPIPTTTILCGTKLYSFSLSKVLLFDLSDATWRQYDLLVDIQISHDLGSYKYFEYQGEQVVLAGSPLSFWVGPIPFYKLEISADEKTVKWVELTDDELDGRIWFYGRLQSFCVRVAGSGRKLCWFGFNAVIDEQEGACDTAFGVHCCDMKSGVRLRLTRDYFLCHEPKSCFYKPVPCWIDMDSSGNKRVLVDQGITDHDLLPFPHH